MGSGSERPWFRQLWRRLPVSPAQSIPFADRSRRRLAASRRHGGARPPPVDPGEKPAARALRPDAVADPAMGGPGAPSPIDQNLGLVVQVAARSSLRQTLGKVFI